jgi:hypothetical protein
MRHCRYAPFVLLQPGTSSNASSPATTTQAQLDALLQALVDGEVAVLLAKHRSSAMARPAVSSKRRVAQYPALRCLATKELNSGGGPVEAVLRTKAMAHMIVTSVRARFGWCECASPRVTQTGVAEGGQKRGVLECGHPVPTSAHAKASSRPLIWAVLVRLIQLDCWRSSRGCGPTWLIFTGAWPGPFKARTSAVSGATF